MRFTPVNVCANTYQRPSSSAKLRKYDCPFASNCNFNLPLVRKKQATKKQTTDFTDFHRCLGLSIRDNPRQSVAELLSLLFLVFYIHILRINHAFVLLGATIGRGSRSSAGSCFRTRSRRALRLCRFVHVLSQFVRSLG